MNDFDPAFPGMLNCKNVRFTDVDNLSTEQFLFDGYWKELINLYGVGLKYQVHRYDKTQADNLYSEHISQEYADPIEIVGLVELQENAVSLSKYGFVTDDSITLYLHIQTYTDTFEPLGIYQEVNQKYIAPKAGDIFELYEFGKTRPLGLGGKKFIVTERTDQDVGININQLAGHYVWVVKAKRYDPSYEPNVDEEPESYQIFDEDYTGRIVDNVELKEQPSEQKQYNYSVEEENTRNVFDYIKQLIDTSVYGTYVRGYIGEGSNKLPWYATTKEISEFTSQPEESFVNKTYFECTLQPEYGDFKQAIRIPKKYNLSYVEAYDDLTQKWNILGNNAEFSKSLFTPSNIMMHFGDDIEPYTQFTYNGPTIGNKSVRFYVNEINNDQSHENDISKMKWYATTETAGKLTVQSNPPVNNEYYECELQPEINKQKQAIQIPGVCNLDYIKIFNPITNSWEIMYNNKELSKSQFNISTITISDDNTLKEYKLLTHIGPTVGRKKYQFFVTVEQNQVDQLQSNYPWYATTAHILVFTPQPADTLIDNYFEFELVAEDSKHKQTIQIPNNYIVKSISTFNKFTNKWDEIPLSTFELTSIIKHIDGKDVTYNQYTNTSPTPQDNKIIRFYI